jgi:hypothetical protein
MEARYMGVSETATLSETNDRLTWVEICRRHPDRWVVLAKIDWVNDTDFDFRGADVIAAFEQRKDASPTVKSLLARDHRAACFWTGEIRGPSPRFAP